MRALQLLTLALLVTATIPPAVADSSHITIGGHECTLGTGKFEGAFGPVSYSTRIETCPISDDYKYLVDGNLELLSGNLLSSDAADGRLALGASLIFQARPF